MEASRRARKQLLVLIPLLAVVVCAYLFRTELFGADKPVRLAAAAALMVIGWLFARSLGRVVQPRLMRHLDPGSAGVAGFIIRLFTLVAILLVSLWIAGLRPRTLAVGGAFTAVVLGLAAQQTFGNVFAGLVLLAASPFKVGDRVRFNGFGMDVEGTVAAHGLLYVTMTDGEDLVLVPNNTALTMSVRPLRQPASVDMRARLPRDLDPVAVQQRVAESVSVPTREAPNVVLEELDGDDIILRVQATPADHSQGGQLARDVIDAIAALRGRDGGRTAANHEEQAEHQAQDTDDHQNEARGVDVDPRDVGGHGVLEDRAHGDHEQAGPDGHASVVRPLRSSGKPES
jgi:small conductance mechanosensitive channel